MKNNLFLVTTPYQLINVLNIIEQYFSLCNNDIIFLHKNMKKYSNFLDKNSNVNHYFYYYFFEKKFKSKVISRLVKFFILITGNIYIRLKGNSKKVYDNIFVVNKYIQPNLYSHFYKKNKNIKVCVYDDGLGTYLEDYIDIVKYCRYEKFSKFILNTPFLWDNIEQVYVYYPELIEIKDKKIMKNKIFSNSKVENLFSSFVPKDLLKKYKNSKFIFLDQGNTEYALESTNLFFSSFNKLFDKKEIIVKKHPRFDFIYNDKDICLDYSGIPFESIIFNDIDLDKKILVSMFSTACLTPYILKNKHPYIIFLGSISTNTLDFHWDTPYFKNVINNYTKNKIFIPKNISELQNVLEKLKLI